MFGTNGGKAAPILEIREVSAGGSRGTLEGEADFDRGARMGRKWRSSGIRMLLAQLLAACLIFTSPVLGQGGGNDEAPPPPFTELVPPGVGTPFPPESGNGLPLPPGVNAPPGVNIPPGVNTPQGALDQLTNSITNEIQRKLDFCIVDAKKDQDDAFNYEDDRFITECAAEQPDWQNRLCSRGEVELYIETLAKNTDFLPSPNCNTTSDGQSDGCQPGWAAALGPSAPPTSDTEVPQRLDNPERCCKGFFCPNGLTCMMPCPKGSFCPVALPNNATGRCDPYGYQIPPKQGCGGADRWATVDKYENLFCEAGFYCPSPVEKESCTKGHFCRLGSIAQTSCSKLTICKANTDNQNLASWGIILIILLAFALIILHAISDNLMQLKEKRKAKARSSAAKEAKEHVTAGERWRKQAIRNASTISDRLGKTLSRLTTSRRSHGVEGQSLTSPGMFKSHELHSMAQVTIDEEGSFHEAPTRGVHGSLDPEDLYPTNEVPEVSLPEGISEVQPKVIPGALAHTQSQMFKYAYGQIEKEKYTMNQGYSELMKGNTRPPIELSFKNLSLFLKGSGKKILSNVTGKLAPGRITAVMGPSGAGKTTFLNALAGKATHSTTAGVVLINGRPGSIHHYKKIIGFVPQDDIVHGTLTVEENLWFSANCRLPINMPQAEKIFVVERIISFLGLEFIRDSLVGTVEKRGISGGQRKRVNVGLEMVMEPSLLILDEPTSGLDSTSSRLVLQALRREAAVGVNIGVVLHQPSYGLFQMFDDVMFLAKGGRTVYLGPVNEVEEYFLSLGVGIPERINPPDHIMDTLEGLIKPSDVQDFDKDMLPIYWMQHKGYEIPVEDLQALQDGNSSSVNKKKALRLGSVVGKTNSFMQEALEEFKVYLAVRLDGVKTVFAKLPDLSHRDTPGFWKQFFIILRRVFKQRFRESRLQLQDYIILLLAGASLGFLSNITDQNMGSGGYTYTIIALSLLCMIAALRTFSNDKLTYYRESASGINRLAYFVAKDTVDLFNTIIKPVVYLSMFYFFNSPRSSFAANFMVTLVLVYCVTGIGYVFAILMEPGPAQLWSVFVPIIGTLIATKNSGFVWVLAHVSYAKWALEAYVIANAKRYSGVWLITRCGLLLKQRYRLDEFNMCMGILVGYGIAARIVAFLCLVLCNRNKQK